MPDILSSATDITARKLIELALGEIGAHGLNESLEAESAADCLVRLNAMLNTLSGDGLNLYQLTQEQFDLTAGQLNYEIGENGAADFTGFNTVRPERIDKTSFIRDANGYDYPLEVLTKDQYNAIGIKTPSSNLWPSQLYYDPSYPLGMIYFDYASDGTHDIFLVSEKPFTEFAGLTSLVSLPAGYREMLVYNLALRLAGPYRKTLSQTTAAFAVSTLRQIQNRNAARRPIRATVKVPAGSGGGVSLSDFMKGEF